VLHALPISSMFFSSKYLLKSKIMEFTIFFPICSHFSSLWCKNYSILKNLQSVLPLTWDTFQTHTKQQVKLYIYMYMCFNYDLCMLDHETGRHYGEDLLHDLKLTRIKWYMPTGWILWHGL
jgi:hypothetical protein